MFSTESQRTKYLRAAKSLRSPWQLLKTYMGGAGWGGEGQVTCIIKNLIKNAILCSKVTSYRKELQVYKTFLFTSTDSSHCL